MSQHHLILKSNLALDRLEEEGSFSGYASVFDHVDQQKDRVIRGAFRQTLERDALPKMLWQHNPQEPIGVWHVVEEDHKGLYVQGQLLLDLQKAKEAHTLMKRGVVTGLSIGCQVVKASYNADEKVRHLEEVSLMEISLVTFAANTQAKITAVKGLAKKTYDHYTQELFASIQNAIQVLSCE